MARKFSSRLVVDASVARAAGSESAEAPLPKNCRDFLAAMLRICHRLVLTPTIQQEWRKHESDFTRKWRVAMERKDKIVFLENVAEIESALRQAANTAQIEKFKHQPANLTQEQEYATALAAMLKDKLLLEAALATDHSVVSLDDTVRKHFKQILSGVPGLSKIVWVNPANPEETPLEWLEQGAKPETARQLGHVK